MQEVIDILNRVSNNEKMIENRWIKKYLPFTVILCIAISLCLRKAILLT